MAGELEVSDPRLEPYRHVGEPAWLSRNGLFVAEGRLVVQRLVATGRYVIESILVTPAAQTSLAPHLSSAAVPVLVATPSTLEQVTGFDFHRGCLALVRRPAAATDHWLDRDQVVLVIDGVGNPDNVGGLFRTAAALGAGGVIVTDSSGDPLYRKAIRTSMGAVLRLPWTAAASAAATFQRLRGLGFTIAALTPRVDALALDRFAASPAARLALVVGSEGDGLSSEVLSAADQRVRIPQAAGVDSLNVTVAAGIALNAVRAARE